ncbi:MAG: hypothetical protein KQA41_01290 [Candidatus Aenigmarchaeota archaeon]|nr:hypothetical protein [Candidatus Aenigmarchaeota archaeon]MBU5688845.1 hypothetical protein [Candidatus Aenigmarchaeota archaeon]
MEYPNEVLTKNRKGQIEVRNLIARGSFVLYDYRDPESFKIVENGKKKIYLKDENGNIQEFYIIPTKTKDRELLLKPKRSNNKYIKVWNNKKKTSEELFF